MVWGWLPVLNRFTTCGAKLRTDGETPACCENAYGIHWNIKTEKTTTRSLVRLIARPPCCKMSMRTDYLEENGTLVTAVSQDSHFSFVWWRGFAPPGRAEPCHHTISADAVFPAF